MNIETLQIKRVTDHWDKDVEYVVNGETVYGHKHYVPKKGELVLINVGTFKFPIEYVSYVNIPEDTIDEIVINATDTPFFVIGDGTKTLSQLVVCGDEEELSDKPFVFLSSKSIIENVRDWVVRAQQLLASTLPPFPVTSEEAEVGNSVTFARSDHKHSISKDTIINIIKPTNGYGKGYHNIQVGTSDPNESGIEGEKGDIYIRYE